MLQISENSVNIDYSVRIAPPALGGGFWFLKFVIMKECF